MENEQKPVRIVSIRNIIPLFKEEIEANSICLLELEEVGNKIVSQKGLYKPGDKALFIEPDYSLSDIPIFESFVRPNGDVKKSRLGSNLRVKAIKFNLHVGDYHPVYSYGILMPLAEVINYIMNTKGMTNADWARDEIDYQTQLGITKWSEPDDDSGGLNAGKSDPFPKGVHKTDETNINNVWGRLEKRFPIRLIGTEKIDGSSITLWYKDDDGGIASRNNSKPLLVKKVVGRKKDTLWIKILRFFGKKVDLNIYEEVANDSDFVKYGIGDLEKLSKYCFEHDLELVLQGEIAGQGMKGSGNKNNPHAKDPVCIRYFNVCDYSTDESIKLSYEAFKTVIDEIGLMKVPVLFDTVIHNRKELEDTCEEIFRTQGLIEGIVVRDEDNTFSAKYMNLKYDEKKN